MIRFDVLPDDVLLDIFDFYVHHTSYQRTRAEVWQSLVHVCRRWRSLVFRSSRRLNLRLICTPKTRTRDTLDTWPALPLIVEGDMAMQSDTDNIIAALGQSNRVCRVGLYDLANWQLEKVLAAMQVPFPELTDLYLSTFDEKPPVINIPDSFLGGSAPRLRAFNLNGISFPGVPTLLSSATHLVLLSLTDIPHSGYISPEAMVALLLALSSLEELDLQFQSSPSHLDLESRSLPPPKRSILPALTTFDFRGVTEYLEDLVTIIDAPQLNILQITFLDETDFRTQRLAQFIHRTPKLGKSDEAHVELDDRSAHVQFGTIRMFIICRERERRLSFVAQICNSSLPSTVEDLYIERIYSQLDWQNRAIENTLWVQLLLPFTAVKNLYLCKEFAPGIAAALREPVGARITEVLPSLQNFFVEGLEPSGPFQENIGQFVAARQLSDHPIAISDWHNEFGVELPIDLDSIDSINDSDSDVEWL